MEFVSASTDVAGTTRASLGRAPMPPAPFADADADAVAPCNLASRHIDSPARTAAFWQQWMRQGVPGMPGAAASDAAPGVAVRSAVDWFSGHRRLVVVSPHPDDEVLMCSGLLQHQLARGGAVQVLAVTDGEACFGPNEQRAALGLRRRAEGSAGLKALGASAAEVLYLGLPDGAVAAHEPMLQQRLLDLLRADDLVVCTWRLDGHPDHDAVGRASAAACAARGSRLLEAPVWMWHWAQPQHPAIDWQRLAQMPLCASLQAKKWQALQCHQSQLVPRGAQAPVVDAALQVRAQWPFECFFTA